MKKIMILLMALVGVSTLMFLGCDTGNGPDGGDPGGTVAKPTAVQTGNKVALSSTTPGVTIYYTIDGTTPTSGSSIYSSTDKVTIKTNTPVKALATKAGWTDSDEFSGTYTAKYNRADWTGYGIYTFNDGQPSVWAAAADAAGYITFADFYSHQAAGTTQDEPVVHTPGGDTITLIWVD